MTLVEKTEMRAQATRGEAMEREMVRQMTKKDLYILPAKLITEEFQELRLGKQMPLDSILAWFPRVVRWN